MKNTMILKLINDNKIDELKRRLEAEIYEQTTDKKDIAKAVVKLSKLAKKSQEKYRPSLAGAWIDKNGKQCICDGFFAYQSENVIDGCYKIPDEIQQNGNLIDLDNIFNLNDFDCLTGYSEANIDIKKLKATYDIKRTETKDILFFKVNNTYFDTDLFLPLIACFDNPTIYVHNDNTTKVMFIKSTNARGIVLPLKIIDKEKENKIICEF